MWIFIYFCVQNTSSMLVLLAFEAVKRLSISQLVSISTHFTHTATSIPLVDFEILFTNKI